MQKKLPAVPEPIRTVLMRRIADRLGAPTACPSGVCRRHHACVGQGCEDTGLPCQRAAHPAERARFDLLLKTVDAIRTQTLWPELAISAELRAVEAAAIEIIRAALPVMPDFTCSFEDWLRRYHGPPKRPDDTRAWLRYARAEIDRLDSAGDSRARRMKKR